MLKGCILVQWTLTNPKNLGPVPIQISEIFGLVNAYSSNGVLLNFYLMHLRIALKWMFRLVKVRIKGVQISEGPLYNTVI